MHNKRAQYCTETDIFLKTTRAGSGSGFGGEIPGFGSGSATLLEGGHNCEIQGLRSMGANFFLGHTIPVSSVSFQLDQRRDGGLRLRNRT